MFEFFDNVPKRRLCLQQRTRAKSDQGCERVSASTETDAGGSSYPKTTHLMICEPFVQRYFAIFVRIELRQVFLEFPKMIMIFWSLKLSRYHAAQSLIPFFECDESVLVQVEKFKTAQLF